MKDTTSSAAAAFPVLLSAGRLAGLTSGTVEALEDRYIEAADDLRSKEAGLQPFHDELWRFIRARDALMEHPEFAGHLPETYYSGGDLDPVGASTEPRFNA